MVEIRTTDDLENWFKGKPRIWKVLLGNRAVLRTIPLLGIHIVNLRHSNWRNRIAVPLLLFNLSLLSQTRTVHFEHYFPDGKLGNLKYHFVFFKEERFIADIFSASISSFEYVLYGNIQDTFSTFPIGYSHIAAKYAGDRVDTIWNSVAADITALEAGVDLWTQPLWLDDTPEWAVRGWETLATELTRRAPYWRTLVRWYEDRLHGDDWAASQGRPAIPELDIARASLPDSYWKKGGKAVNQAIAKLEDYFWNGVEIDDPVLRELVGRTTDATDDEGGETGVVDAVETISPPGLDAIPAQARSAIRFDAAGDGPIDLAPVASDEQMLDTPGRREDYAELRYKTLDLLAQGVNRLGRIKQPLDRFLTLGDDLARVRAPLFWSRINTFRIDLADHDEAVKIAATRSEPDDRLLDGVVAGKLRDVVQTINRYVSGDPILLGFDAHRFGPREATAESATVRQITPVLKVALSNTLITVREAGEIVIEQAEITATAPATVAGRLATDHGSTTVGNYVSTLIRRGYTPLKPYIDWSGKGITEGALREIGKRLLNEGLPGVGTTAREILVYIAENIRPLMSYAADYYANPAVQQILELIHKMLS